MKARIIIELSEEVLEVVMKEYSLSTKEELKALLLGLWLNSIEQVSGGAHLTVEVEE